MSIRLRLNLALGLVLALAIASMVAALLLDAGPRLNDEIESSMRVTESVVRTSLAPIEEASVPAASLIKLVDGLKHQRHVRVELASRMHAGEGHAAGPSTIVPSWLKDAEAPEVRIPVHAAGKTIDTIIIVPEGGDEMREVWETIGRITAYGALFSLGAFLVTGFLIQRSLAPIHDLGRAMQLMELGDYDVAIPQQGPPEIAAICTRLNTLAAALQKSRAENRRLSVAMVQIQDEERRDIARELHDELGPYLFSIRAGATAVRRTLEKPQPDAAKATADLAHILDQIDALQQTNRRVLQRLSPVGLKELGLAEALRALITMWGKNQPDVEVAIAIATPIDDLDETTRLTIYRVVQEGLTNAYRHAGAQSIAVDIADAEDARAGRHIAINLSDNGEGLPQETQEGYGLKGLRERVGALGGALLIARLANGGTQLSARIPVSAMRSEDGLDEKLIRD